MPVLYDAIRSKRAGGPGFKSPWAHFSMKTDKLIIILLALWWVLVIGAPFLAYLESPVSGILYYFFSINCHQIPERSFFLFGKQLPICIRCTAIQLSFTMSALIYIFSVEKREIPSKWYMIFALIPVALDGLTQMAGIRNSSVLMRIITGSIVGAVFAWYFVPGIGLFFTEVKKFINKKQKTK